MVAKKELDPANQGIQMNMTPMIDCVFLILIFFMIVSEMSSLSTELLALPYADQAQGGVVPDSRVLTVNIRKNDAEKGLVRIMGRAYDKEKLAQLIRHEAVKSKQEHQPGSPDVMAYNLSVNIRCDRAAKYESVQNVFDACSKNKVYKTTLAASPTSE